MSIREKRKQFKEKYYAALQELNMMEKPKKKEEKEEDTRTKKELFDEAIEKGLVVNNKMTKADLQKLLEE